MKHLRIEGIPIYFQYTFSAVTFTISVEVIDVRYTDYILSRDTAWRILLDCQIDKLPVDLNSILRQLHIRTHPYKGNEQLIRELGLEKKIVLTSGLTFYRGGSPYILYDDTELPQRIRFTIAHELGHLVLGHITPGSYTVQNREPSPGDSPMEVAANRFAVGLLAPACVLWALDLHTQKEIASACQISRQAAAFRAERMAALYRRRKFLSHPLERAVYRQFEPYIREWEGRPRNLTPEQLPGQRQ